MSRIHLNRDRQNLGQFTPEEVAIGLKNGRFLPTDLAWREGMETWQPLSSFTDLPEPPESPETAETAAQPESPAAIEVVEGVQTPAAPVVPTPAWEEDGKSAIARTLETVQRVLLQPQTAFSNVPDHQQILKPLTFLILLGWPCMIVSVIYQLLFSSLEERLTDVPATDANVMMGTMIVFAIFIPAILTVGAFLSSAIFHVILMMFGEANRNFWVTFRVLTYVNGSTMLLMLMPMCGGLLQGLWALVSLAIGLKTAHQTSWVTAIVTVLLPTVICCGIIVAIIALAVGGGAALAR